MHEEESKIKFELIITIVERHMSADVIDASRRGGAEGGTILKGRGSGIHERMKLLGLTIEPEKEIVLTLVDSTIRNQVVKEIAKEIDIDKPGHGILFVLDVSKVAGIPHLKMFSNDNE